MNDAQFVELSGWITEAGLSGQTETASLAGFCQRIVALGLPLTRASVVIDTLHPVYEGRAFTWKPGQRQAALSEYGRNPQQWGRWERSPFYRLETSGERLLRCKISASKEDEFPILSELRADGITDYVAIANRFAAEGIIGDMDCVYSSWASNAPQGFSDADIADLCRLTPLLALAMKSVSLARVAETLVETYLGRDAGRRVLQGRIDRGRADRIEAVLWFSDLRNYTRISDTAAPEHLIPLLNDYAEAIISTIHEHGGDVLKLMGDGTLAIFTGADRGRACRLALAAASSARRAIAAVNVQRSRENLPTTEMYLGLHAGEVFYGNIGSKDRLDFTVVGPAVNEVSRIAGLCRSVDQPLLVSSAFASAIGEPKELLVSVGRYALRGVARAQDLFTIENERDLSDER
ncbi:MAG TPA: adenylate/guanylate cyclase domain-containing protein [Candidatus Binatia bacterium]|nr:adenylate/guanylate cyclase domain-containing protein [Candidatus Binatia bacterium]